MSVTSRVILPGVLVIVLVGCTSASSGGGPASTSAGAASPAASPAAASAVASVGPQPGDLPTLTVQATIEGPSGVANLTSTEDAVWVLGHSSATLARIDPATNTMTASLILGAGYANGLGLAGGRLWTFEQTAGEVMAIDPKTAKVVERVKLGQDGDGFWIGDDAAWLLTADGSINRIDGKTAKVTSFPLSASCPIDGAATGAGFLWIASADGVVCKLDEKTGAMLKRGTVAGNGRGMAVVGGRLWIAGPDGGVSIVDPDTLALTATLPAPAGGSFEGSTWSLGTVDGENTVIVGNLDDTGGWIRYTGGTIGQATGPARPSIRLFAGLHPETFAGGVTEAFGSVWVASFGDGSIERIELPAA
jgi:streptogramin lyase